MKRIIKFFYLMVGVIILTASAWGFNLGESLKTKTPDTGLPDTVVDQLGNLTYSIIIGKSKINKDIDKKELTDRVLQKLIQAAKKSEYARAAKTFKWEATIVEDLRRVDAKVFPGGKIIIYSGLFSLVQRGDAQNNEAQMATVLGHEMGHALARHAAQRIDRHTRAAILTAVSGGSLTASNFDPKTTIAIMGAMGAGYAGTMAPPFQRKQEAQADEIGVTLMAKAGFDPNQAVAFFQALKDKQSRSDGIGFLANHPSTDTRIAAIKKIIPKLNKY